MRYGIRTNQRMQLLHPDDAPSHPHAGPALQMPTEQLTGSPQRVAEGLRLLAQRTHADELMITGATYDVDHRIKSLELIHAAMH